MFVYKINVAMALKEKGYTPKRIRDEKILSQSTMTKLYSGDTSITLSNLDTICDLLDCQPGDLLEHRKVNGPIDPFIILKG